MALSSYCNSLDLGAPVSLSILPNDSISFCVRNLSILYTTVVFQLHSFEHGLRIGTSGTNGTTFLDASTHAGVAQYVTPTVRFSNCSVVNPHNISVMFQLVAIAYTEKDPVPGGCNQEFNIEMVPMLLPSISSSSKILKINLPLGNRGFDGRAEHNCNDNSLRKELKYTLYAHYSTLGEIESSRSVFDLVANFYEPDRMINSAREVCSWDPAVTTQGPVFLVNNWPGIAAVFGVVLRDGKTSGKSSYVPFVSAGCKSELDFSCENTVKLAGWILMGIVGVAGLFICFFGHKYFKTLQFLVGFSVASVVTFILTYRFSNLQIYESWTIALTVGLVVGVAWYLLWWAFGIPIIHVLLILLCLGFIVASLVSYFGLNIWPLLRPQFAYFIMGFLILQFGTVIGLVIWPKTANIVSCVVIGSFTFASTLSVFMNGTFHYIAYMALLRFTLPEYGSSICFTQPFFLTDIVIALVWAVLALIGVSLQFAKTEGSAPFPPCPRQTGSHRWLISFVSDFVTRGVRGVSLGESSQSLLHDGNENSLNNVPSTSGGEGASYGTGQSPTPSDDPSQISEPI